MLTSRQIRIVRDTTGKSKKPHRGYAFIVYEREQDMKGADYSKQLVFFEMMLTVV